MVQEVGGELFTFYAHRDYRPLWLDGQGVPTPAATSLLEIMDDAELDGLSGDGLRVETLRVALTQASASRLPADLTRAELLFSRTFVAYVEALRTDAGGSMIYEHDSLRPKPVSAYHLLNGVAEAPSQLAYIADMRWMHPLYAPLRRKIAASEPMSEPARRAAIANLKRLRGIPGKQRHVLVDAASARLWMYEDDRVVDTMRVVVGKPSSPTPLMAGYIRYAIQNPYWNVPPDMAATNIAPNVLRNGSSYLNARGYQVLSDWSDGATVVDPRTIDWQAVSRGTVELRVRQLPGAGNAMGDFKYEFPNPQGIYLHDTPQKDLLRKDARHFSGGCIRLEDAKRLGLWLMAGNLPTDNGVPEQKVDLPTVVPIYITYLSIQPGQDGTLLALDPYKLNSQL